MERFKEIIDRLLAFSEAQEDVKGIIAIGSQCRAVSGADEYSDLDLIIACGTPDKLLYEDTWLNQLGKMEYSFIEDTLAGQKERRVLFEGSLDVDFVVVPTGFLRLALENHMIDEIMDRGFLVLYDSAGFSKLLENINVGGRVEPAILTGPEFKNLVNDFFYHTVWAEKKLLRGEIWTAKMCVDAYLKNRLLKMIEMYEVCLHGAGFDVWHNGRMLDQWADGDIRQELEQCFAHYRADDIRTALAHTVRLFTRLAKVCEERYGYTTGVTAIDRR